MFILFKIVNVGSISITINVAFSYVVADPSSDIDNFSSENESSESSDDDQPLATVAIQNNQQGKALIRRNTIRTRQGARAALAAKKPNTAQAKELELEEKWKIEFILVLVLYKRRGNTLLFLYVCI